jgi:hypothetical protein
VEPLVRSTIEAITFLDGGTRGRSVSDKGSESPAAKLSAAGTLGSKRELTGTGVGATGELLDAVGSGSEADGFMSSRVSKRSSSFALNRRRGRLSFSCKDIDGCDGSAEEACGGQDSRYILVLSPQIST